MAERSLVTAKLYQNVSRFLSGGATSNAGAEFTHLALCGVDMAAFDVDTANFTEVGDREAVSPARATTTKTDDTVKMEKDAWEPGANTVYGAGIFTTITKTDDNLQAFHEWAASVTFEAGDKVKETLSVQSVRYA